MIEAWGRGIERIFDACRDAGTPMPEVELESTGLWTVFHFLQEHQAAVSGGTAQETREKTLVETPVKRPVKTPERILEVLVANPDLALADVAKAIGKSLSAVERASAKLVKEGRLRRVGPRKGGCWEVTEDNHE